EDIPTPNLHNLPENNLMFDLNFLMNINGSTATYPLSVNLIRFFRGILDDELMAASPALFDTDWDGGIIFWPLGQPRTMGESAIRRGFFHNGTASAYQLLISGQRGTGINPPPLIFAVQPDEASRRLAQQQNTELILTPIINDGFIFMVHTDNPVNNLTLEQLCAIYSGQITNWAQVGGRDEPIVAFQRNEGSGSQTAMNNMVMLGTPMMAAPSALVQGFMGSLLQHAFPFDGGLASIGYSYGFYVRNMAGRNDIKFLSINDIAPTDENISSGLYPLTTQYYVVTVAGRDNTEANRLIQFILSPTGQEILRRIGYIPVNE
ncbi:MAG: substrate-binding domain-containing protein, partial [Spirochaetaceae bacterium]|nr:substrate-binding domain-containing protein [Spirochaetaceae bacterium]